MTWWVVPAIPCMGVAVGKCPGGSPAPPPPRASLCRGRCCPLPAEQRAQQVLGAGGPGPGLLAAPSLAVGISAWPDG